MSGITIKNFSAYETVPLTLVANTSGSVDFKLPASLEQPDVMVTNVGTTIAFVAFGNSAITLTAQTPGITGTLNATPVPAGDTMVFTKNQAALRNDRCAAISTGTPTLYFTSGVGS